MAVVVVVVVMVESGRKKCRTKLRGSTKKLYDIVFVPSESRNSFCFCFCFCWWKGAS